MALFSERTLDRWSFYRETCLETWIRTRREGRSALPIDNLKATKCERSIQSRILHESASLRISRRDTHLALFLFFDSPCFRRLFWYPLDEVQSSLRERHWPSFESYLTIELN